MSLTCALWCFVSVSLQADEAVDHFESNVRPALIEHCLECHSSETEASGNLLLDSREGWQLGGDLGPAVIPGDADASVLIRAIEYRDPDLQMPPDGKMDAATIEAFRKWVRDGASDPRVSDSTNHTVRQTGLPVERATEHWAYRPIRSPESHQPATASHSAISGALVDLPVASQLREAGLQPAPPAGRQELIRRLTFDLHGLPPSPAEVEAFVSDPSPEAYERLVDRLLASPRFAEHFARRWMDVVRYAESITLRGFILPEAWRYRDYLVEAFHTDRPFDRMIRDQLAGDLQPTDDIHETQLRAIATGFLAMGNSNLEDQDKTKLEFDYIDEQLETIGRAFLAQTIGCARCHDHKFDPIPTRDYYALAGIFRSTTALKHANLSQWIDKPLPLGDAQQTHFAKLESRLQEVTTELKSINARMEKRAPATQKSVSIENLEGIVVDDSQATLVGQWVESDFVAGFVASGYRHDDTSGQGMKTATFEPEQLKSGRYEVRMSYTAHANRATNVMVTVFSANESKTLRVNQRRQPPIDGRWFSLGEYPFEANGQSFVIVSNENADGCVIIDAIQFLPVDTAKSETADPEIDPKKLAAQKDAAQREAQSLEKQRQSLTAEQKRLQTELDRRPKYLTISDSEPKDQIAIRIRGLVHQEGDRVQRGFLTAIAPATQYASQISSDSSGRIELADWIADPRNPLTARVYVNRIWSWLMGEGIVATENNFGTTGESPSHPEVLDALADELIKNHWSTKHIVRTIVTSDTYRRSLDTTAARMAIDPENRLYASASLKRLPVESLRDAMLSVSGELDLTMGGSLIRPKTRSDYDYRHESTRRSLYLPVFRNSLPPLFDVFDFADASVSVGQRARSTVAPQSLAMMNHPWVIARARAASARWLAEPNIVSSETLITELFQACFSRKPESQEMQACLTYLGKPQGDGKDTLPDEDRLAELIQSLFASIDFRYLQ